MNYLTIFLVAVAGAGLSIQAAVNAELRAHLGHSLSAATIRFCVGLLGLVIATIVVGALPSTASFKQVPWWGWVGGLLGAFFLVVSAYSVRSLGTTLFFATVIASQLVMSLLIDHYGLFGQAKQEISISKLIGIGFLVAGIAAIKWR